MSNLETKKQIKERMNQLIHQTIHDLHNESEKLLDLTPENDKDCISTLQRITNDIIIYLRMRSALDIE